jgi:tRNA1Val (adenine37-N6)-methyltransferase
VIHGDIRSYANAFNERESEKYDLVISNPPFYEQQLKSGQEQKDMAMHDSSLTLDGLLSAVSNVISSNGGFAVLLPYSRKNEFLEKAAAFGLKLKTELRVKQSPRHDYFRAMMYLRKSATDLGIETEDLTIKEIHHAYSLPFVIYLQDYYLSL